jgi:hypothetical protein
LETKKWRKEYVNSNWLNQDLADKTIISCTKAGRKKPYEHIYLRGNVNGRTKLGVDTTGPQG